MVYNGTAIHFPLLALWPSKPMMQRGSPRECKEMGKNIDSGQNGLGLIKLGAKRGAG